MAAKPKVLYVAHASATGGRDGHAGTDDNKLSVTMARPKELGGNGAGVNPEQLFATGYSACFLSAMQFVAGQSKEAVPRRHHRLGRCGHRPDRPRFRSRHRFESENSWLG